MTKLTRLARAKVNLCLHVTGKRDDGYHLLDSIVVFPEIGDVLTVEASDELSMTIDGPFAAGLSNGENSVLSAARLMSDGRGAKIQLTKNLPVAGGIGGGSSDAAAALRLLSKLWDVAVPNASEVLKLGADVPVCLSTSPQRMRGIGDILSDMPPLPEFAIVLVNSGGVISTAQVFKALPETKNPPLEPFGGFINTGDIFSYLARQRNDMQSAAITICPEISHVISALQKQQDCVLARMSGSGGTSFGLFETLEQANAAAKHISQAHLNWWVKSALI